MKAAAIPIGARLIDTDVRISLETALALKKSGVDGVIRYISIGAEGGADLTLEEADDIVNGADLGLVAVQHVRYPGWYPTSLQGAADGMQAVKNLQQIGYPEGASCALDWEGIAKDADKVQIIGYGRNFHTAVVAYPPLLYVGADVPLDRQDLFELPFAHYWKSLSAVDMQTPECGWQIVQLHSNAPMSLCGIPIDYNFVQQDYRGRTPFWAIAA